MTAYALIPLLAWLSTLFAAALILGSPARRPEARTAFLGFLAGVAAWQLLELLSLVPGLPWSDDTVARLSRSLTFAMSVLGLGLAHALVGIPRGRRFWWLAGATLVAGMLMVATPLAARGTVRTAFGVFAAERTVTWYLLFSLPPIASALVGLQLLERGRRRLPASAERRGLGVIVAGSLLSMGLVLVFNVGLLLLGLASRGPALGPSGMIFFAYAIVLATRHHRFLADGEADLARTLLASVPDGIMVTDGADRVIRINPAAATLLGRAPAEVMGAPLHALLPPEPREPERGHREVRLPGSDRVLLVTGPERPPGNAPPGRLVVLRDVTAEREAERVIQESLSRLKAEAARRTEELTQLQKAEALTQLSAGIAHHLNNQLTVVMGFATLARDALAGDARSAAELDAVLRAARRGAAMVRQLDARAGSGGGAATASDVQTIVEEAATLLRRSLPDGVILELDLPGAPVRIAADGATVHRLLVNLCANGVDAMRDQGGILRVRLDSRPAGNGSSTPACACLSVSDTGSGIRPEVLAHMYDPYFTTKAEGEGTGLGLTSVREQVGRLGGSIDVETREGEGTTFRVALPLAEASAQSPLPTPDPQPTGDLQHVLVVDDQVEVGRALARLLEALGYRVTLAGGPDEALERFAADPETFQLVITDFSMPGMTGDQLAASLHGRRPDLPILLISGYADVATRCRAAAQGIRGVLTKPVSLGRLSAAVREALSS
jgi:signal transduction histidine kinase/CheY-like chemotaxis protein